MYKENEQLKEESQELRRTCESLQKELKSSTASQNKSSDQIYTQLGD